MSKKSAISNIGYAIVSVIVLGIIMIISAPMLVTNVKEEKGSEPVKEYFSENVERDYSELRLMEERLSSRIDELEQRVVNQSSKSDKYVCSIEGKVNDNGDVIPIDNFDKSEKIVFVCEYRQ